MKLTQKLIQEFRKRFDVLQGAFEGVWNLQTFCTCGCPSAGSIETFLTDALSQAEKETKEEIYDMITYQIGHIYKCDDMDSSTESYAVGQLNEVKYKLGVKPKEVRKP